MVRSQFEGFTDASFKGLNLDVATTAATTELLGQPDINRSNVSLEMDYGSAWFRHWFGDNTKKKTFQRLIYKNLDEFSEVNFFFDGDRLVWVRADLPSPFVEENPFLSPNDLSQRFTVEFRTFRWAFGRKLPPLNEFGPKPDHKLENDVPFYYLRIGVTEKAIVSSFVNNNNENLTKGLISKRLSTTRERWREINSRGPLPGYVSSVHIISRALTPVQSDISGGKK